MTRSFHQLQYAARLVYLRLQEKPSAWMTKKKKKELREKLILEAERITKELRSMRSEEKLADPNKIRPSFRIIRRYLYIL